MSAPGALACIGWQGPSPAPGVVRVVAQHRGHYEVHDGAAQQAAQPGSAFLRPGLKPEARPAVGDFVRLEPGTPATITEILPRRSLLLRAAAGERYKRQVIAANLDTVLVLTGLDGDWNAARIERYLTLITASGIQAVVVLTKADAAADAAARRDELQARLGAAVPVLALDARSAAARAALAPWLQPGQTLALVGSSGAGKSTLGNTLLGAARQATGTVRRSDSRGRHTTTHRALLQLPGGACIIDTPGMRQLKLTGEETLENFADIEALAARCRFNDCRHGREPGCAVQAAVAAGTLEAERLRSFLKLEDERRQQRALRDNRPAGRPPRR